MKLKNSKQIVSNQELKAIEQQNPFPFFRPLVGVLLGV